MLLPLDDDPELRRMLEVWLEHNGSWGTAAGALGINRHTCGTASTARRCASVWIWRPSGGAPRLWNALRLTAE